MGLIRSSKGRFDSALNSIMSDVRQPVFIDNAVHYAKSEPRSSGKTRVTIEAVNADNYDTASEGTYSLVESESSVLLVHTETDGHTLKSGIWSGRGENETTELLYGEQNPSLRIMKSTVSTTSDGLQLNLRNMQNKTLTDIGFDEDKVHLGQPVDVGFRTTDLAMRLSDTVTDSLTAVSVGSTTTITKMSNNRRKNSNTYLASDFNGVNLITALRFVSRHDNRIPIFNRFGVLNYVPFNFTSTSRAIDSNIRFGSKDTSPIENVENRITVQGVEIALNERLIVTMDDRSKQQGKYDIDILENTTPVFDASITNTQQAKHVARQILKANSTMNGAMKSMGHPNLWDIRPGDVVEYDNERLVVLEAQHKLSDSQSHFTFLSTDAGLEGLLQGVREGSISASSVERPDRVNQILTENFSFFNSLEVVITPSIDVTTVSSNGFLIGRNSNRGQLGGNNKKIGLCKETNAIIVGES